MVPMVPTPSEPLNIRCAWYREPRRILDSGVGIKFLTEGRWAADRGGLLIKEADDEGGLFEPRVCGPHTFLEFPYFSPFRYLSLVLFGEKGTFAPCMVYGT